MSYMDTYKQWCTDSYFDEDTKDSAVSSVREPTG